jgi:phosphoglycerate dehydrogenase-like enzyme
MSRFHVGLSAALFGADGTPCFDPNILNRLFEREDIQTSIMPADKTEITAEDAADFDAVYLMLERISAGKISAHAADNARRLRLVARHGVGFDSVDVAGLCDMGIMVTNTPDAVRRPVATMALTMMLAVQHRLIEKHNLTRAGRWAENADFMGTGLTGKVLGVLGAGSIGSEILRMAAPFDLQLKACDPHKTEEEIRLLNAEKLGLDALCKQADILIIATALTAETTHIIDAAKLSLMKKSAILINVARGPVIHEPDLIAALQAGAIRAAGLDVFEQEPVDVNNPLLKMDNVITTSHSLCWTDECFDNIARDGIGSILSFADRHLPTYIVERAVLENPAVKAWFNL